MPMKSHDNRFRHFSNIKYITWVQEPIVLVLLMRGMYDLGRWNGLRRHDIRSKFHDDWNRHLSMITVIAATIWEALMLVLLIEGIYEVASEMASCGMICIPSFMKIGTCYLERKWRHYFPTHPPVFLSNVSVGKVHLILCHISSNESTSLVAHFFVM
jgi:hypothetical protein